MGYPIEDTIDRYPIIVEDNIKWLKEIAKITTKTCAIIGFVEPREDINIGKKYYNSLAVIQNGAIKSIVRKSLSCLMIYSFNKIKKDRDSRTLSSLKLFGRLSCPFLSTRL